jgi:DNA repair protein RadA/Sms
VGCFDLSDAGIVGLPDPSGLFLSSRDLIVPGTCVTVTLEGRRPLVTEVQALLSATTAASPRRTTSGLDGSRVAMILAVLDKRADVPVRQADCYVSTVGGVRVSEPASDLAIALAIASSVSDRALPRGMVAMGEVGLAGEIRAVTGIPRRLAEAARLGFAKAVVPAGSLGNGPTPEAMRVVEVCDIREAVNLGVPQLMGA